MIIIIPYRNTVTIIIRGCAVHGVGDAMTPYLLDAGAHDLGVGQAATRTVPPLQLIQDLTREGICLGHLDVVQLDAKSA